MLKVATALFALAFLGSSALAHAQTPPAPAASAAPAAPAAPAPSTMPANAAPAAGTAANWDDLMSSLNDMQAQVAKVRSMNGRSVNNVRPVNVAQLSGANPAALNSAVARNQAQVAALRSALGRVTVTTSSNQRITLAQFLADNKIGTGQVVGADFANGMLYLFYQKP